MRQGDDVMADPEEEAGVPGQQEAMADEISADLADADVELDEADVDEADADDVDESTLMRSGRGRRTRMTADESARRGWRGW